VGVSNHAGDRFRPAFDPAIEQSPLHRQHLGLALGDVLGPVAHILPGEIIGEQAFDDCQIAVHLRSEQPANDRLIVFDAQLSPPYAPRRGATPMRWVDSSAFTPLQ